MAHGKAGWFVGQQRRSIPRSQRLRTGTIPKQTANNQNHGRCKPCTEGGAPKQELPARWRLNILTGDGIWWNHLPFTFPAESLRFRLFDLSCELPPAQSSSGRGRGSRGTRIGGARSLLTDDFRPASPPTLSTVVGGIGTSKTSSLSRQLLRARLGMWQALIAEFTHAQLIGRLVRPPALGTGLTEAKLGEVLECDHKARRTARINPWQVHPSRPQVRSTGGLQRKRGEITTACGPLRSTGRCVSFSWRRPWSGARTLHKTASF